MTDQFIKYTSWKDWAASDFGCINKKEASYFRELLKRAEISGPVSAYEIGFGNGKLLGNLKHAGHDVYGVEVQSELAQRSRQCGYKTQSILAALEKSNFDLIIALDVLEHIEQHELLNFVSEFTNSLNDHGIFIARFPNGGSPLSLKH